MLTHNDLRLSRHTVPIAHLPEAFEGFRIVQISDLHFYERTNPAFYEQVSQSIAELAPDLLALTGDVVHFGPDHVQAARRFLEPLCPTITRLAVMGNHDYYDGARGEHIRAMLQEAGFDLLINENRRLEREGQHLWVAGLDDLWYGHPNLEKALGEIPADGAPVIAMIHNPLLFDPLALAGFRAVDLVLAGHTHAGHVYIPVLSWIYKKVFRMKYRYGFFEKNGCCLHVTSGVGSAAFYLKKQRIGLPRFRFNTRPEIAVLELTGAVPPVS